MINDRYEEREMANSMFQVLSWLGPFLGLPIRSLHRIVHPYNHTLVNQGLI